MRRLLQASAFTWGIQFAFLNPALGLLLGELYHASLRDVGWSLLVYNIAGLVASTVVPMWADRYHDYLGPLLAAAACTLALAGALELATNLPTAVAALMLLGAPAGVGTSLLFAHVKHSGASLADMTSTRAMFSVAWMIGPPLATLAMGAFGNRAILAAIALVAVGNIALTVVLNRSRPAADSAADEDGRPDVSANQTAPARRGRVALALAAFTLQGCAMNVGVTVMAIFVTRQLHAAPWWAGSALGLCAGLEIPALVLAGRMGSHHGKLTLVLLGTALGTAYYAALVLVHAPGWLVALQVLNALFVALADGIGLAWFQDLVPAAGMASGLYFNSRKVGAIIGGGVIGLASSGPLGVGGVYLCVAVLLALSGGLLLAARPSAGHNTLVSRKGPIARPR